MLADTDCQEVTMHRQQDIDYHRVARGIDYITTHYRDAPELADIAAAAHLSPFHFQRLFTAWAGVSPKSFTRYLGLAHARDALRHGRSSLLDAALECGLSGPGRLHDMFVGIEGMTPGEYARGGAGLTIRYAITDSLFGRLIIASTDRGICHMAFTTDDTAGLDHLHHAFPEAAFLSAGDDSMTLHTAAQAALAGDWSGPDAIRLHLHGTPFQMKVWEALLRIPRGALASYGDVAAAIGAPRASRAVASAIAANPVAVLIPCHRVIRQTGHFGGYAWGEGRKRALIGWEAAACACDEATA
jgi:AraC family transcriptional regulator of adaptative response/methylated-DNA-[protein]-cysteine methyltransferase